ncbi:hypothetical protein GCM10023086_22350 [Streptomyces venetus]|uniref:Uncharacterized protein n=1 Tax=Streptomyces venetus TaxID=1701086 RepID=A0ABP8FIW8_9ACTN
MKTPHAAAGATVAAFLPAGHRLLRTVTYAHPASGGTALKSSVRY